MIEYRFRVPSVVVFTLYSYSKALEYHFRLPTAGSLRLSTPYHYLNTPLKKYSVLVIQDSHLYTNFSRSHIYSILYFISTIILYYLSYLFLSHPSHSRVHTDERASFGALYVAFNRLYAARTAL
jgi:hypothetical protein